MNSSFAPPPHAALRATPEGKSFRDRIFADESLPRLAELGPRYVSLAATDTYERGLRALVAVLLDPVRG